MSQAPVTLILGGGPDARGVRSALIDFTALGMIDRFLWADAGLDYAPADSTVEDVSYTREDGLKISSLRLSEALHDDGGRQALLLILDMAGDPDHDSGLIRDWHQQLTDMLHNRGPQLHIAVPDGDGAPPTQYGDMQTLIVSPEDAATPLEPKAPVDYPDSQHTASTIASVAGLWATASDSPFAAAAADNRITGNHGYARLVRSYHSYLDASATENDLYDRVFDLDENLPHPRLSNERRVLDVGDDQDAAAKYAAAVMHRHEHEFVTPVTPLKPAESRSVGAWEAVKRFFQFFFRVVIGSPKQWVREIHIAGSKAVATGVQKVLYGSDSNVEVILGGQSGQSVRSVEEITAASAQLNRDVNDGRDPLDMEAKSSLGPFWRAYVHGAMTLVDGGQRAGTDDIVGPNIDKTPAIVSDARWSVPSSHQAFDGENHVLRTTVGPQLGETTIQAYDPYGARAYSDSLDYAARNTTNASVHRLKSDFDRWVGHAQHSFGWQMGERLSGKIADARDKVAYCRDTAAEFENTRAAFPDEEGVARSLAGKLRGIFVLWLVLIALVIYLCVSHYNPDAAWVLVSWDFFTWQRSLLTGILISVVLLIIQMVIFARANRGIFDRIEERRILQENEQIVANDLRAGLAELEKTSRAYSQFLAWSAIVGRVIAHPFGEIATNTRARRHPESGLPRNTSVSENNLSEDELARITDEIRQDIFGAGWAGEALEEHLRRGMELSQSKMAGADEIHKLYGQPGTNSQLANIAAACRDGRDFRHFERADRLWAEGLAQLRRSGAGTGATAGGSDLRRAVESIEDTPGRGTDFSAKAVTPQGVNYGATRVDETIRYSQANQREDALSESYTVVEYGANADIRNFGGAPVSTPESTSPTTDAKEPPTPQDFTGIGGVDGLI